MGFRFRFSSTPAGIGLSKVKLKVLGGYQRQMSIVYRSSSSSRVYSIYKFKAVVNVKFRTKYKYKVKVKVKKSRSRPK